MDIKYLSNDGTLVPFDEILNKLESSKMSSKYWRNITYPSLLCHNFILWFWKKVFCPKGFHLFDEYASLERHCLYCDACEISIEIDNDYKDKINE